MKAMEISRTGLDVEWRRLEIIAENIANVSTTRTASGKAYQVRRLLSGPAADFAAFLSNKGADRKLLGVSVYGVETISTPQHKVHDPSHPHADADGFISLPGLDMAAEMTLMVKTSRAYESNIVAMNIARQMYAKALDLGRRS